MFSLKLIAAKYCRKHKSHILLASRIRSKITLIYELTVTHGNSGETSRSAPRINALESGNTSRRLNGSNRSVNIKESSNQIVLYDNGQSSRQVRDLSMAIAFAFENSGNLTKIGRSSSNPLVKFFKPSGRKMDITTFSNQSLWTTHEFPAISHVHIAQISKGVHKLNQILRACSNGLNFDQNSTQIGKELLKGAIDLEVSLRMLVHLQDSYQQANSSQNKTSIKLLEEDEDDEDGDNKPEDQWKLDRPTFSFDKPPSRRRQQLAISYTENTSQNSKLVPHRRSTSYVQDLSLSTARMELNNYLCSPHSTQEQGRISNVIAKLMGLEEIPLLLALTKSWVQPTMQHHPSRNSNHSISQRKPQDHDMLLHEDACKRAENAQDKHRAEQKEKQFQKQNLIAKNHEGQQVELRVASKSKRSTSINGQKKLSDDKSEKVPRKDRPSRRNQETTPMIDVSQKAASDLEIHKNEYRSHNTTTRKSEIDTEGHEKLLTTEKSVEMSATEKRSVPRKVERSDTPQKIDVMITRKDANMNHLERSIKNPANMLKDLKQQMHNKNRGFKKLDEQSDSKVKEGKGGTNVHNATELISEPLKLLKDNKENEDYQKLKLRITAADECQLQNTLPLNYNCEAIVLSSGKVSDDLQAVDSSALKDYDELKQSNQSIESTERYALSQQDNEQYPTLERLEQLTEPEKQLKETVIKSQMFLTMAEALFKLNLPVSFLHDGDSGNNDSEKKLVLDCAHEVMKRKAWRQEIVHHPYMKTTISSTKGSSLDDLVRQLCKYLETLKFYGMNGDDECDVAAGLFRMLNKDIYNECPDVNTTWDSEWSQMRSVFPEMEEVVKDMEKHMLNGLLNEITNEFLLITVSA